MPDARRGVLLVLAGTSGAGKGTIGARLRAMRSRAALVGLVDDPGARGATSDEGVDYHFVTREEFERLRDAGGFLEWFEVYGDLKGTPDRVRPPRSSTPATTSCSRSTSRARWRSSGRCPRRCWCSSRPRAGRSSAGASRPGGARPRSRSPRRLARAEAEERDRRRGVRRGGGERRRGSGRRRGRCYPEPARRLTGGPEGA